MDNQNILISKESINFKNMKWFSSFCITEDSHTSINLSQTHCRYRQGYKQAKTQLIVKWARGPACWILTHIHEKINFKMNLNPTTGTDRGIKKPNLTHSHVNKGSSMLDPHQHSWILFFQNLSQTHCRYRQGYNQAKTHSLTTKQGV
jgi:hypothetical protein